MWINFNKMLSVSATLLGLAFAALVFAYGCYYGSAFPPLLKTRMVPFLWFIFCCNFCCLFSCFLSLGGITFVNANSPVSTATPTAEPTATPRRMRLLGLASLVPFVGSFLSVFFALMVLLGLGDIVIKIIEAITQNPVSPLP